jgi:predicted membrane channel-forming protein YqfA (hemolysin III family)
MKFDLSSINLNQCSQCEYDSMPSAFALNIGSQPMSSASHFTFSLAAPSNSSSSAGLVRRFAAPVLKRIGIASETEKKCSHGDDPEHDQFTIQPGRSMCFAVLCKNDTGRKHPGSLLGDFGHIERLSSWVHLVSGIVFAIYAILRPFVITREHTVAESMTTAAAWSVAFAFFSSTVYHVTSPSKSLALWTRQLDYFAIYLGIAVGSVADFAISTRSFQNTSILAVVDGPLACVLVAIFFFVRRSILPSDATWDTFLGGCTLSFGLMRKTHLDLNHTGVRQATSFLLSIAYFVTVPLLFDNFGTTEAATIFLLELGCLGILVAGMVLDNHFVFPDVALSEGKGPRFLVCKGCGCIGSSHALWHILTVLAAIKCQGSREYALSLQ